MTRRNARVRREETTTSRDTSSAESTSSITYLYTQVMHLRKSTPSARTGPRRPRTSVALGHPSPSDARVLVDSPVHRIGVDISVCDQEHSRLGDRRANLASHVPGTVKFRTGGDSPRPASFMPAADSVKFRNRQSESGWEEHGGLGRCVSVHMTAPSHTPDRPGGSPAISSLPAKAREVFHWTRSSPNSNPRRCRPPSTLPAKAAAGPIPSSA